MASYMDIDVRLHVVEDKIDLIMKSIRIQSRYEHPLVPGQVIVETKTLLDVYRELKGLGLEVPYEKPSSVVESAPESAPDVPQEETVNGAE
jgi:hypothetical protein